MYIRPDASGTYYIRIYSKGNFKPTNYFFYAEPDTRTFWMNDFMGLTIDITGNIYSNWVSVDFRNLFPKNSIINSFRLSNGFYGTRTSCIKQICSYNTLKTCTSKGSLETMNITSAAKKRADQIWQIRGKSENSISGVRTWKPHISINFTCDMKAYPGNER